MTVFIGTFMAPLDSSIVNISLPALAKYFSVGITTVEWVVMAYLLTTSSLLLTAGRLGDIRGHKIVYVIGFVTFTAASALCGLAGSIGQLIFFRVVQALGGTCMLATGPAILTDAFPPTERGKALGLIAISVSLGLTFGPFLGGVIVANLGWRWIFFVNIPVGIMASILAAFVLRKGRRQAERRFDFPGSATAFAALFATLLVLSKGNEWGWGSVSTLSSLTAAIAFACIFILLETRAKDPMLDLSLFRSRLFSAANISALINYVALFVVMFLIPFYLLDVFGETTQRAGIVLTAVPLVMAVIAPISGALSDRIGSRLLSSLGLAITSLALLGLSRTSPIQGLPPVALFLGVVGLGSGMFQSPNTSAIMGSVPRNRLGIASGMQATMRNVGMVLGVALAGAIVSGISPKGAGDQNFALAVHVAFLAGAAICAVGVLTSLVRGSAIPGHSLAREVARD
jgi:EmrB/QacA subfamily drug resistance transporter